MASDEEENWGIKIIFGSRKGLIFRQVQISNSGRKAL